MTKVTGWDNGLSQDYDKGLGRWFANRLGARQQLRQDFEMTQHITQEVAIALAKQAELFSQFGLINGVVTTTVANVRVQELCNAAIQWDRDQRKAESPVLPRPYFGSGRYLGVAGSRGAYTTTQIQTYGAACAAQARKLALEEAKSLISKLDAMVVSLKPYEIVNAIEALKGK